MLPGFIQLLALCGALAALGIVGVLEWCWPSDREFMGYL